MNSRTFKASSAHRLEDPERLKWLPPQEAIGRLSLVPGLTIADIGAGTGYFSIPFAHAVAPDGKVLAVDFQPEMLELLGKKLEAPGAPRNIQLIEGSAERTGLPDGVCDVVFFANIWHELDDTSDVVKEADRILKPEGRIAILDWCHELDGPPGPPAGHRVAESAAIATVEGTGGRIRHSGAFGPYSYLMIATKPANLVR